MHLGRNVYSCLKIALIDKICFYTASVRNLTLEGELLCPSKIDFCFWSLRSLHWVNLRSCVSFVVQTLLPTTLCVRICVLCLVQSSRQTHTRKHSVFKEGVGWLLKRLNWRGVHFERDEKDKLILPVAECKMWVFAGVCFDESVRYDSSYVDVFIISSFY